MSTSITGWTTLAEEPLVLLREYSFGPATANALAVRLPGRKWLLVSAPRGLRGLPSAELEALSEHGEVAAMVAPNGEHFLGLGPCRELYPRAQSYATPAAREYILNRGSNAGQLLPISELAPLLGDKVQVVAADGCTKTGDVLVRVFTERGPLVYTGDFIANIPRMPDNLLFRLMFKLTKSGPGFRVFRIFFLFFVSDKRAARDFLIREFEAHPPAVIVPGHGDVVAEPGLGPKVVSMLRAAV